MRRRQQALDAQLAGVSARTPAERASAARAAEAAQYNEQESPAARRFRIEQAGVIALAQAEHQLTETRRERARGLEADLERQQFEMTLIGKTSTEVESLRKQYELIANLKADAAKSGLAVDEQEIDLIKRKTEEYGRLAEQMGLAKMQFDLGRQLSDSGLSNIDKRTVQTLRQYGQPEDLGSQQASDIRNIYRQMDAQEAAKGFLTSFQAELVASGGDVGDAFSKALKSSMGNLLAKMLDESLTNLGNALVGALFKGAGGSGKGGGSVGSAGMDAVSRQFNGAAPVTPVERAPLGDMTVYAKAIQSIESGGNYGALGPITKNGDRAYGAFQVMGNNIGPWSKEALGRSISAKEFLANPALQDKIFQHRFGGYVDKFGPSGAAQAWFGGPGSVGKGGAWTDVLGTSGNAYVEKFNDSLKSASTNLAGFGSGLGKIGQSLGGAFPAAPPAGGGGGGLLSWLGGLFGGGANPFSVSPQAKSLFSIAGTGVGLFADGTPSAPGGLAVVGERGRELVNLPRGAQVIPSHQTESLLARGAAGQANQNARPTMLQVVIQGASGDDHVRSLVNEGVQTALHTHNEQQRRGGFSQVQTRFSSQKG
ncbi:hypothetical protein [Gellertiella hungarica]|uniref:Phage tail lysozyme domain-containing protein n=1 Tax=Gellertiella hungarica TaxID=1572859 RepID=A0A7W6NJS6_9HYPH|nr:hypothetical protein [Gellertiella hungarica]MBB4064730.1 hypothetical protein [Gellertiella hungarica]